MKDSKTIAPTFWGAIEAGGTKFTCAVFDEYSNMLCQQVIPTSTPKETLQHVKEFFYSAVPSPQKLAALGIASFGPLDLNRKSPTYGFITQTPKPNWSTLNLVGYFRTEFKVPIGFETDVNGAALGELLQGAAQGCKNIVYVTVGTGIGAGVVVNGALLQGISHPEVGHMLIAQQELDVFSGACPFHNNCLEGLASGTAINLRWGARAEHLPASHPAWQLEAFYLATLCVNLTLLYAPEKIILGGGVMAQQQLFPLIRMDFAKLLAGYAQSSVTRSLDSYIVPAGLQGRAGILGALVLAKRAYNQDVEDSP